MKKGTLGALKQHRREFFDALFASRAAKELIAMARSIKPTAVKTLEDKFRRGTSGEQDAVITALERETASLKEEAEAALKYAGDNGINLVQHIQSVPNALRYYSSRGMLESYKEIRRRKRAR
jgi:hypothetical protein